MEFIAGFLCVVGLWALIWFIGRMISKIGNALTGAGRALHSTASVMEAELNRRRAEAKVGYKKKAEDAFGMFDEKPDPFMDDARKEIDELTR